jgi:hypothetical protein
VGKKRWTPDQVRGDAGGDGRLTLHGVDQGIGQLRKIPVSTGCESLRGRRPSQKNCNLTHSKHYVMELTQTACTAVREAAMHSR